MLVPVLSEQVSAAWAIAEPFIKAACRRGPLPCDAEDLRAKCEDGRHQLWICEQDGEPVAAAVTGLLRDEGVCIWVAMGGDFYAAADCIPEIEQWARSQGCSAMRSFSRVGMVKRFPADYRTKGVILERKL